MNRNADQTRKAILQIAYEEMHRHGFQGMRVDAILEKTGIKKGGFYHHFDSKRTLAFAVIDEVIADEVRSMWIQPIVAADDPIKALINILKETSDCIDPEFLELGCPLFSLAQEMSPIDEEFRIRLDLLFKEWLNAFEQAFRRGQKAGTISAQIDIKQTASFVVASMEGCIGRAKISRSVDEFTDCANGLLDYLNILYTESEILS